MKITMPSWPEVLAAGRHVVTASMTVIATLAFWHILTPDQARDAGNAVTTISNDVAAIFGAVSTIIAIAMPVYAMLSATLKAQIARVQEAPQAQVTVTDPKLAEGIPGVKVKAK